MALTCQDIQTIAVVGSGYMGGGIAQVLARSGRDVLLADLDAERARDAHTRLTDQAQRFEDEGLFSTGSAAAIDAHLAPAESIEDAVRGAQFVVEAVFEKPEVKSEALGRISRASKSAVIGSNTSALPIRDLAASVTSPERFLGVHWMNPAPFIPGVEIIPHDGTAEWATAASEQLVAEAGKNPGRVSDSPGFVANRLQFALFKEAVLMVEEGLATPEQIDTVVSNAFGFRLALFGPFAIGDMAGLDVYDSSYRSLEAEYGERFSAPAMLRELVERGDLGLKSGRGFLDIPEADRSSLVEYRDRAYAELSALRHTLGAAPGL